MVESEKLGAKQCPLSYNNPRGVVRCSGHCVWNMGKNFCAMNCLSFLIHLRPEVSEEDYVPEEIDVSEGVGMEQEIEPENVNDLP